MNRTITWILFSFICTGVLAAAEPVPTVTAREIQTTPVIDGRLDEACWQGQSEIPGFIKVGTNAPAAHQTRVRLARNNAWLFLAFECADPRAGEIKMTRTERDASVNRDESVEVFISPGTDGRTYYHFMLSAGNVQGDNRAEFGSRNIPWAAHWRSAAVSDATRQVWTAELAIPLFLLMDKSGSDAWRFNVCRNKWHHDAEASSWAPLAESFHTPEKFGVLRGLEKIAAVSMFAPVIAEAKLGNLTDLPERGYEVVATLQNQGALTGVVNLAAADVTAAGTRWTEPKRVNLAAGHKTEETVWVRFNEYEPRSSRARIALQDDLGSWEMTQAIRWERSLEPFTALMDRSFYTTESEFYLVYHSPLPASVLAASRIRITGAPLAAELVETNVAASGRIRLPLKLASNGAWQVEARLETANGKTLKAVTCELVKRDPNPAGNTVKIDHWRRCVLLNDRPFFPYGFYSAPPENFSLMAACGANSAVVWSPLDSTNLLATLDRAQSNGIYLQTSPFPDLTWSLHKEQASMSLLTTALRDTLPGVIGPLARHPALLAWHMFDEPPRTDAIRDALKAMHDTLCDLDGYHPALTGDYIILERDPIWTGLIDVGFPHHYWLPAGVEDRVDPRYLAKLREIRNASRDLMKPIWLGMVGEFHSITRRMMTPAERRVNVYLALINEFTGLYYFAWPAVHETTHATIREIRRELDALAPALMTRTPDQTFTVQGGDADSLQALLKAHPAGGGVLLAANTLNATVEVTFSIDGLADGTRIVRMFDPPPDKSAAGGGRAKGQTVQSARRNFLARWVAAFRDERGSLRSLTFVVKDQAWRERLEPYGVRAYRIPALPDATAQSIALKAVIRKDKTGAAKDADINLVVNAGFEGEGGWDGLAADKGVAVDPTRAHTGNRSLRLTRADAGAPQLQVVSALIILKPNTRYRIGAWMYGDIKSAPEKWGGPTLCVRNETRKENSVYFQSHAQQIQGQWQKREGFLDTGAEPETIRLALAAEARKFTGDAWVDDVFVEEMGVKKSRNLLPNSGFEYATTAEYPDRWMAGVDFRWLKAATLTPKPDALVRQDTVEKTEGQASLRLRGYVWLHSAPTRPLVGVRLEPDTDYVFSVYMKADRENFEVRFSSVDEKRHLVKVGKTWQRYHWPVRTGKQALLHATILTIGAMKYAGSEKELPVLWLDAAQFEKGTTPTEYVPDAYNLSDPGWASLESGI